MKIIMPTKKEVFDNLRENGCTWVGGDGSCSCFSRQLALCYEEAEKRLTKTAYTEEEKIYAGRNSCREVEKALDLFYEEFEEL